MQNTAISEFWFPANTYKPIAKRKCLTLKLGDTLRIANKVAEQWQNLQSFWVRAQVRAVLPPPHR